ncbi:MAG: PAS domain-containing protein, partial [Desulfobacterales bacterium]|nr:PAS domain-containing protein [Desulfobacterales bacterium]
MENNPVARDLLNTIPVGVFRMSPEGRFVDLNPAAADILGYPEPQAVMALPALAFLPDPSAWPFFLSRIEKETTAF